MFNQFQGIRPLVEGLVDSDYLNCVPTGTSVVDRTCFVDVGEFPSFRPSEVGFIKDRTKPVQALPPGFSVTGDLFAHMDNYSWNGSATFSKDNVKFYTAFVHNGMLFRVYLSNAQGVLRSDNGNTQFLYVIATDLSTGEHRGSSTPLVIPWISQNAILNPKKWSWAVSSTKPNQVFFTFDTKEIFWFNMRDVEQMFATTADNWEIHCMTSVCLVSDGKVATNGPSGEAIYVSDRTMFHYWDCLEKTAFMAEGEDVSQYTINQRGTRNHRISWYDNKLLAVDSVTGVVNLTCTDPAQFFRNITNSDSFVASEGEASWNKYKINNVWTNWYASTLSSDFLIDVIPAFGFLFFINKNSVECWVRTGSESAPLHPVSSYVMNVTIRSIELVGNYLLAVGDENGKTGVFSLSQNEYKKLSNSAVDKFIKDVEQIGIISQNRESHIAFFTDTGSVVFSPVSSTWYRLTDKETTNPTLFIDEDRAVSSVGSIVSTTRRMLDYANYAETNDTSLVSRKVVDCLLQWNGRKSFSQLDVIGDMGSVDTDAPSSYEHGQLNDNVFISLEVSTTRGKTWSRPFYRKSPPIGRYDAKVTYNGLGSGETFLIKLEWFTQNYYTITALEPRIT